MIDGASAELIRDAQFDLVEAVEHVKLRQCNAVDAACDDRLTHQYGIEPAAAALASRDGAEFGAARAETLPGCVGQFRRERTFAHARRVGFDDAKHITHIARPAT